MNLLLTIVALVVLATTPATPEHGILRNADGVAVWIPEKDAIRATGLREDVFPAHQLHYLKDLAKKNGTHSSDGDCSAFSGTRFEHFKNTRTFRDLIDNATQIVRGRVSAGTQGFLNGRPGTLFPLNDCDFLKGARQPGRVLLFYPEARIVSAEGELCARALHRASAPDRGTMVMAFDIVGPFRVEDVTILCLNVESELVHVGRDGRVHAPPAVMTDVPVIDKELTELASRVRDIVRDAGGR